MGVTELEQKAILDSFEEKLGPEWGLWN
ncbi:hypothetical protein [Lysinibacillus boronitolerans]